MDETDFDQTAMARNAPAKKRARRRWIVVERLVNTIKHFSLTTKKHRRRRCDHKRRRPPTSLHNQMCTCVRACVPTPGLSWYACHVPDHYKWD